MKRRTLRKRKSAQHDSRSDSEYIRKVYAAGAVAACAGGVVAAVFEISLAPLRPFSRFYRPNLSHNFGKFIDVLEASVDRREADIRHLSSRFNSRIRARQFSRF